MLTGMQDNGTRIRVSQTEAYLSNFPKAWNQIQGGDGFGAAVSNDANGGNVTTWGVANGTRVLVPGRRRRRVHARDPGRQRHPRSGRTSRRARRCPTATPTAGSRCATRRCTTPPAA